MGVKNRWMSNIRVSKIHGCQKSMNVKFPGVISTGVKNLRGVENPGVLHAGVKNPRVWNIYNLAIRQKRLRCACGAALTCKACRQLRALCFARTLTDGLCVLIMKFMVSMASLISTASMASKAFIASTVFILLIVIFVALYRMFI